MNSPDSAQRGALAVRFGRMWFRDERRGAGLRTRAEFHELPAGLRTKKAGKGERRVGQEIRDHYKYGFNVEAHRILRELAKDLLDRPQREIAERIGIATSEVSDWLSDKKHKPNFDFFARVMLIGRLEAHAPALFDRRRLSRAAVWTALRHAAAVVSHVGPLDVPCLPDPPALAVWEAALLAQLLPHDERFLDDPEGDRRKTDRLTSGWLKPWLKLPELPRDRKAVYESPVAKTVAECVKDALFVRPDEPDPSLPADDRERLHELHASITGPWNYLPAVEEMVRLFNDFQEAWGLVYLSLRVGDGSPPNNSAATALVQLDGRKGVKS